MELSNYENLKDIAMVVILDETGPTSSQMYDSPDSIKTVIEGLGSICEEFEAVFVGSGLATVSRAIDSSVPLMNVRMLNWSFDQFKMISHDRDITAFVSSVKILSSLTTNARCAYLLEIAVQYAKHQLGIKDPRGAVNVVLAHVARSYVGSNSIQCARSERDK